MKTGIFHSLAMEMDTLQIKMKPEKAERELAIFPLNSPKGILGMEAHLTS